MKYAKAALVGLYALIFVVLGCGGTQVAVSKPEVRAAIDVAKDAWVLTAQSCVDAAAVTGNTTIAPACRAVLDPAHDLILAAAKAYDASGQPDLCALNAAAGDIASAVRLLGGAVTPTTAAAVDDAVKVVGFLASSCGDAGVDTGALDAGDAAQ